MIRFNFLTRFYISIAGIAFSYISNCDGLNKGENLEIYTDNQLVSKNQRMNEYVIRLKALFNHHIYIYRTFRKQIIENIK